MQIKIDAQDMLCVLVDAGIDETDAKAIIFDLLQLPESGSPERQSLIEARKARVQRREKKKAQEEYVLEDDGEPEETENGHADDDQEKKLSDTTKVPIKPTRVKKPKRVTFAPFGGTAPPLR